MSRTIGRVVAHYARRVPIRTCVGCRNRDQQDALLRVAWGPSGFVISRTAPGRGAWMHPGCGGLAWRRRAVPRALRLGSADVAGLKDVLAQVDSPASAWANHAPSE
ncbi:YlxR family protein [Propioniciclava sp.]|uniref:YlxR family protein n=1 Tax=Propioniciclava sp. TaxID=2038686 RepID=UPI0039E492DD